jgi:hypothetical protein
MRAVRHSCLVFFCGVSQGPLLKALRLTPVKPHSPILLIAVRKGSFRLWQNPPGSHGQGTFQTVRPPYQIFTSLISLTLSNLAGWMSIQQTPVFQRQPLMCIPFPKSGSV